MFEFTEEDLKINKRGQLSPSQKEWLKMVGKGGVRVQGFNVWIAIGFMFLGLCLILALFLQNRDNVDGAASSHRRQQHLHWTHSQVATPALW